MTAARKVLAALRDRLPGRRAPVTDGPAPAVPSPITRDRVRELLAPRGEVVTDDDGDLTGLWRGCRFWFLLLGEREEILQVRGRWNMALPVESRLGTLRALNDWNRDRIWPKVYLRDEEPGLVLYAEVSFDLEHGVTNAQLDQFLGCGIATGSMVFDAVSSMFGRPQAPGDPAGSEPD